MKALTARRAGLLLALLQAGLLISLGGVYLLERARLPRGWARVAPVDPDLPIRGRYVSLQLLIPAPELEPGDPAHSPWANRQQVRLIARNGRLEARASQPGSGWPSPERVHPAAIERIDGIVMAQLSEPLAFFIPSDGPDPSQRPANEQLWVEVTVPAEGPPRPIRLGVRIPSGPGDTTAAIRPLQR